MTNNKPLPNWNISPFTLHLSLFLFLFAIYLFTYTPRINSSDGQAMFATAESLIRRGALDIEQLRWMDLQQGTFGLDGLLYSRKGIGAPVGLLPLTWLGLVVPWWGIVGTGLLFNAIVTALTAVVILAYLQELGFSQRIGLIAALTFGLTTLAWPYAKSLFSDPFSGLLLLSAAFTLLKFYRSTTNETKRWSKDLTSARLFYPFLAGLFLGWNVATRYAETVFLPIFGLLLFYYLFKIYNPVTSKSRLSVFLGPIAAFATPLLLIGLALVAFNLSRYGDPFNTGYLSNETFGGILWEGLLGQLVSPGRGLFLYCPIFLLSLMGLPSFFRRRRPEAITALSVILVHLFLYGKWFMWHGGYAWGARFLVPTLPFWVIFLAPVIKQAFFRGKEEGDGEEATRSERGRDTTWADGNSRHLDAALALRLRFAFLLLATLGLIPQLLSVIIDFTPFQNSLLDTGLPLFDPQTFFDPQYSPFMGAWKFISPNTLDLAWAWQGQINVWLLAGLIVNIGLTGFNLWLKVATNKEIEQKPRRVDRSFYLTVGVIPAICMISTFGAVMLLLSHVHTLPSRGLTDVVVALNEAVQPADTIITNNPEASQSFAELYKGRAPVLGLNSGGPPLSGDTIRRVNETIARRQRVWWLPDGLPPEQSAVEQILTAQGFRARNDNFEGQRLVLLVYPNNLAPNRVKEDIIFADQIELNEAVYLSSVSAGEGLPVELRWQALVELAEDYHVFIHLVDNKGQIVAQADGQPALWTRPTSTWKVGEVIIDRYGLWIPAQTPPGHYQLQVGLYRPLDGQRLHLVTGEEFAKWDVDVTLP